MFPLRKCFAISEARNLSVRVSDSLAIRSHSDAIWQVPHCPPMRLLGRPGWPHSNTALLRTGLRRFFRSDTLFVTVGYGIGLFSRSQSLVVSLRL